MNIALADAQATTDLGTRLAEVLRRLDHGLVVTLAGELGAGKTALVRAVLQAMGHDGPVVSPSYTLIEPYTLAHRMARHMDLYRLGDPEELEFLGVRDFDVDDELIFIEWAEQGAGFLPPRDLAIEMSYAGDGRVARLDGTSSRGQTLVKALSVTV